MSLHACRLGREREGECVCVRLCMYTYTHLILDHIYNMYVTIYTYYRYVIHKYFYCYMVSSSLWLLSGYTHIYISIDMLYIYIPERLINSSTFALQVSISALSRLDGSKGLGWHAAVITQASGGQRGIKKWGLNQQELALHQQKSGMKSTKWRLHQQPKWGLRNQFPCVAIDNKKVV